MAINNLASYLSDYSNTPANLERAAKLAEPLLNANNASMLDTVAWIAYKQGNFEKAKEIMLKAAVLDPAAPVNNYHLGMIYFKLNDNAKAAEHLKKAVDSKVAFDELDVAKETLKKVQG
ncbi:MAG: tetratricopeptide repeat protein [Methylomonas sp.]